MEISEAVLVLSALSQSTRLEAFQALVRHEPDGLAAGDLARLLAVPPNTLSAHLSILTRVRLVTSERRSRSRLKSVRNSKPKPAFVVVHRVDYFVYFKRVTREAFALLSAFRNEKSLSEAIDSAFNPSTLPEASVTGLVQSWFRDWAEWGWFSSEASKPLSS